MTHELENSKHPGKFTIAPDKEVFGELILAGTDSCLDVRMNNPHDFFNLQKSRIITGVLHGSKKAVSLISCWMVYEVNSTDKLIVRIGANLILIGDNHFLPDKDKVYELNLVFDDAAALFPNASNNGMGNIFLANTKLGKISASHTNILDPLGIHGDVEKDVISVNLHPVKSCFKEVMEKSLYKIQGLFGLLIGRSQNILELTMKTGPDKAPLQVYVHRLPEYKRFNNTEFYPQSLINVTLQPKVFACILENWFERDDDWHVARRRFYNNVGDQITYSEARLVIVANLFDILTDDAVHTKSEPSAELEYARNKCREIFKKLPNSDDRKSVLGALGRIGKNTLKRKICHRAKLLIDEIEDVIPYIETVIKEAVTYRNHYVHGSNADIDYSIEIGKSAFLTQTLEFVFFASDLVEAGWNIKKWWQDCHDPYYNHNFSIYLNNYKKELEKFNLLPKKAKNSSC